MKKFSKIYPILHFGLFDIGWSACVLGAGIGFPLIGALIGLALLGLHLFAVRPWRPEALYLLMAAALGTGVDTLNGALGLLRFENWAGLAWLCPLWLTVLWALFASTFNASFRFMQGRPALAAVFGAVGGPFSYFVGAKFGAVELGGNPNIALAALAVEYALITPLFAEMSRRRRETYGDPLSPRL